MRDIFVTLTVLGSLPLIFYRPYVGIVMWAWISYMNPHRISWGFATDFPFAMIIAITTMLAMVFSRDVKSIPWTRETVVLLLFIAWMMITTIFALHPELAQEHLKKVLKIQLMTFITMMLMRDKRRINLLIWTIVISLGFYGVKGGMFTAMTGGGYHVLGPPRTFIGGNNELGLALIMTVPLMRYLQLQTKRVLVRHGLMVAIILSLIAILGTQSRGALLGLLAMAVFLLWKSPKRVTMMLILVSVLSLGFMFMPQSWHERMETISNYQADASAMGRINAWEFAINLAHARPIVGGGFDSFRRDLFAVYAPNPDNVHDSHSIYFEVLGEHGYVGLALFLLLGWFAWRTCSIAAKEAQARAEVQWISDLSRMVQVSLVGYAVSGAFLGLAYFDYYYHLLAVVIVMKVILGEFKHKVDEPVAGAIVQASPIPKS